MNEEVPLNWFDYLHRRGEVARILAVELPQVFQNPNLSCADVIEIASLLERFSSEMERMIAQMVEMETEDHLVDLAESIALVFRQLAITAREQVQALSRRNFPQPSPPIEHCHFKVVAYSS